MSKVMPLPTSTTVGRRARRAPRRACSRAGSAAAASPRPGRRRGCRRSRRRRAASRPRPGTSARARAASSRGLLGQPGRGLQVGRAPWPACGPPAGPAERHGAVERRPVVVAARPASTIRATGVRSGRAERQWKPKEPSTAPTTNGLEPVVVVERRRWWWRRRPGRGRARASGGAGAAEVGGRRRADADQQHLAQRGVAGDAAGTGSATTSPASPVARPDLGDGRAGRARARRRARVGTGAEQPAVAVGRPGSTGRARTSTPAMACDRGRRPSLSANSGGVTWAGVGSGAG